jgi:hypothetical protein
VKLELRVIVGLKVRKEKSELGILVMLDLRETKEMLE